MLEGKPTLALVTGATSGIGKALCHVLATNHVNLLITGRNEEQLQGLAKRLSKKIHVTAVKADLSHSQDRQKIVELIQQNCPDLVVNNAGFGLYGEIVQHETEEQIDMVTINCSALLQFTTEAIKTLHMNHKKGTILNVSSAGGFLPFPLFSVYTATKAFVNQLSTSLDDEQKRHGIRILASCPGMVKTGFRSRAAKHETEEHSSQSMTPEEAAEHMWWQIQKQKPLYIFNWKYRWAIRLGKYLMPRALLSKQMRRSIKERQ